MKGLPPEFVENVLSIAHLLSGKQYAIRGTASLVLQGLEMNAEDVDIICDKHCALVCNLIFEKFLVKKVVYSENAKFRSYFGEFSIQGVKVEVMGEWQIKLKMQKLKIEEWSEIYDARAEQITSIKLEDLKVNVTNIETELKMFSEMGRWNAYWKIKNQINTDSSKMESDKEQIKIDDNEQPKLL
jgi:hypothetical protein